MAESITAALIVFLLIFGVSILTLSIIKFFYEIFNQGNEGKIIAHTIFVIIGVIFLLESIAISLAKLALE